jgi:hypothetical protein
VVLEPSGLLLLRAQIGDATQQLDSGFIPEQEAAIPDGSSSELFAWTLSHSIVPFSNVEPKFSNKEELFSLILRRTGGMSIAESNLSLEITELAHEKMDREWSEWVRVHQDSHFGEIQLDNMLMRILFRFILNRDGNQCVLCSKCFDLTIHHIVRKQRNVSLRRHPFGRSVPTNLVTLCRDCHTKLEPFFL